MQKNSKIDKWNDSVYLKAVERKQYKHDKIYDIKADCVLQNRLLAPQKNIIYKSLSDWAGELRSAIREIHNESEKIKCAARIANVFNHAVIIFMSLDNYHYARELCYTHIQVFTKWSARANAGHLLKYVFQPWLHLIRLNRLEGNLYDAFHKLNALNMPNHTEMIWGENKLLTQKLYQSLQQDMVMYKEIVTQSVIERIQLYFESRNYEDLILFIENNEVEHAGVDNVLIQEARAVSYANSGKIQEAFSVLGSAHTCSNVSLLKDPVLFLRAYELCLSSGLSCDFPDHLNLLCDSAMRLTKSSTVSINHIVYLLHAAHILKMAKLTDAAIKLVNFCLDTSIKVGDEVIQADSLMMLYELSDEQERKKVIEDSMITHYYNTQYVAVQKNMLQFFQDLRYVESKCHHDMMTPLFEDLLLFDIHL